MAQVALLHTEMNSGFRFRPRMGMNSAVERTHKHTHAFIPTFPLRKVHLSKCKLCIRNYLMNPIKKLYQGFNRLNLRTS